MHNDEWVVMAPEKRDGQGLATFNHLKLDGYIARQIRVPIETYYLSAWRPNDESQVPDPPNYPCYFSSICHLSFP